VSQDIASKEQRAAPTRKGIQRMLSVKIFCRVSKRSLQHQTSVLNIFKPSSGSLAWPLVLLNNGNDGPENSPTF
jgi:hypothetical protein